MGQNMGDLRHLHQQKHYAFVNKIIINQIISILSCKSANLMQKYNFYPSFNSMGILVVTLLS